MKSFEKVLDGALKFFDKEIAPNLNDWQDIAARIAIGRFYENQPVVIQTLSQNGIVRAFGIMDGDGNIDIERLASDLKREIDKKGKLQLSIPGFGKFAFTGSDVETLCKYIQED